jgi:HAD superfamily hydrolase (TIGR01549 family)
MHKIQAFPIKAVLFDLDDTLFDHLYSTRQGLLAICEVYSILQRHPIDELFATYMSLLDEVHLRVLKGELTTEEARIVRFRRFFELYAAEIEDILVVANHAATLHRTTYQNNRQVVSGVRPLLEYLHGKVKIGIVTNNLLEEQRDKLRHLRLESLIDELVTSEETGFIKPDPGIFRVALERLAVQASETVMIGDSWNSDILGARQAGIRAIWLNRYGIACPDQELAQELLSFEPLDEILQAIFA